MILILILLLTLPQAEATTSRDLTVATVNNNHKAISPLLQIIMKMIGLKNYQQIDDPRRYNFFFPFWFQFFNYFRFLSIPGSIFESEIYDVML